MGRRTAGGVSNSFQVLSPTKADDGQQTAEAKRHDRAALLAGAMFKALDADGDGVLLCHEVLELARKTGGALTEVGPTVAPRAF